MRDPISAFGFFCFTFSFSFFIIYASTSFFFFFFFNDTATTEIYTLSLHDALPISPAARRARPAPRPGLVSGGGIHPPARRLVAFDDRYFRSARVSLRRNRRLFQGDRKSTRLNSSHQIISYAVFCLKKKKITPLICTISPSRSTMASSSSPPMSASYPNLIRVDNRPFAHARDP